MSEYKYFQVEHDELNDDEGMFVLELEAIRLACELDGPANVVGVFWDDTAEIVWSK